MILRMHIANEEMLQRLEVMNIEPEGVSRLVTVNMYDYSSACAKVLPLLVQAEIVGPPELREYVSKQVQMWNQLYNSK